MFDKVKFAQILKIISDTYESQRDFSKKSGINRTYLSQYINMKLQDPPKPKTLERLADASKEITSYTELMSICGYYDEGYQLANVIEKEVFEDYKDVICQFTKNQKHELENILSSFPTADSDLLQERIKIFSKQFIGNENNICNLVFDMFSSIQKKYEKQIKILGNSIGISDEETEKNIKKKVKSVIRNKSFNCIPVVGKIAAGQPILAEQHIESYLPVDPNIYGLSTSDDLFYLLVSGDSMNQKVENGDYVLVHKQDYAEDGDIVVAIVNDDDEATLKRYKEINQQFIQLEPMSTNPIHQTRTIDLKNTYFKIIGKAIGKFGKF